ncbi:MAG: GvpA family gas vesicle protein [Acidobacteria bacterium]|nr:MAG: GvpA family gas vesicle protein [Acidobacteriota bacterium]PYY08605.1 MAG: GvpA family gas vesicle protein [Acidobacteriota bacterium]
MPSVASKILLSAEVARDEASLLDIFDHVLNKGVIIHGNLIISLAGVDLIYLGLDAILTSVETALQHMPVRALPTRAKQ